MSKDRSRLASVDGLRGMAASMVLLHHVYLAVGTASLGVLGGALLFLRSGVDLFFVLSGFCLFYPFTKPGGAPSWRTFFYRRARRILPPYYAAIAAVVLLPYLVKPVAGWLGLVIFTPASISAQQIWAHLFMVHTLSGRTFYGIDTVFWSLGPEVQFYLSFPLAVWLVGRFGWRGVGIISLITVAYRAEVSATAHAQVAVDFLSTNNYGLQVKVNFFLGRWLEFGFGMLVALLVRQKTLRAIGRGPELLALLGILCLCIAAQIYLSGPPDNWLLPVNDVLVGGAFAALLLLACTDGSLCGRVLGRPFPVWLGLISYSLYLIHYPLLLALAPTVLSWHLAYGTHLLLGYALGVPISLACTALFWYLCERPFLIRARPTHEPVTQTALVTSLPLATVSLEHLP